MSIPTRSKTLLNVFVIFICFVLINPVGTKAQCPDGLIVNNIHDNSVNYCNTVSPQDVHFQAAGGVGPFNINWTYTSATAYPYPASGSYTTGSIANGDVDIDFVGGGSATFSITITDANGCTASGTYNLTIVNCGPKIRVTTDTALCPCSTAEIKFICVDAQPGNVYTAQLSDSSGSFASPTVIGMLASFSQLDSIDVTIPCNTPPGKNYLIRVVASLTSNNAGMAIEDIGIDILSSGTISSVAITPNPGGSVCSGSLVTYTANVNGNFGASYHWFVNGNPVGTNSNTYTTDSLLNGDTVRCLAIANAPCDTGMAVDSVIVSVINCITNVTQSPDKNNILIFPNPSDGNITISTTGSESIKEIIITNTLGQILSDVTTGSSNKTMQVQLPNASGLYFIRLRGGQGEYVSKMVKE